jgi:hypothetical protein
MAQVGTLAGQTAGERRHVQDLFEKAQGWAYPP